ncbi:MAG: hypothetical protein HC920_20500 [Oscillatoriales cyanobacterium SM2_3_0]|nr:hypothetical protein [Oscillatoriales cyanobacterium SM2_3_0]
MSKTQEIQNFQDRMAALRETLVDQLGHTDSESPTRRCPHPTNRRSDHPGCC